MSKPFNPAHPFPCVYLKHGAYWLVKRGKWERIGTTLEQASLEYLRRQQAPGAGKLPELIERTFTHHAATAGLAASTKRQYRLAADTLKRRLAAFDEPNQVKPRHVAQLKVDGAAHPNMTNRVVGLLRTLFGYWLEWGHADTNPCVGVRRYKEPRRTRLITMDEWWAIHQHAGPRLQAIMKVAYLTGQRIGDVLSLRRAQCTAAGIEFKQQKTGKLVTVRWSPELEAARDEALALHGRIPGLTLFPGRKGKPPDYRSVLLQWHTACKAAGVCDAKPNDQRAQALTAARREGKSAQALAGHSTEAMTARYLRDRAADEVDGPTLKRDAS